MNTILSNPVTLQTFGMVVLVMLVLFKILFDLGFIPVRSGNGHRRLLEETHKYARLLVRWHAPDESGRQEWKNPEIRETLKGIEENTKRTAAALEKLADQDRR